MVKFDGIKNTRRVKSQQTTMINDVEFSTLLLSSFQKWPPPQNCACVKWQHVLRTSSIDMTENRTEGKERLWESFKVSSLLYRRLFTLICCTSCPTWAMIITASSLEKKIIISGNFYSFILLTTMTVTNSLCELKILTIKWWCLKQVLNVKNF
jgi:hypothetical protein